MKTDFAIKSQRDLDSLVRQVHDDVLANKDGATISIEASVLCRVKNDSSPDYVKKVGMRIEIGNIDDMDTDMAETMASLLGDTIRRLEIWNFEYEAMQK